MALELLKPDVGARELLPTRNTTQPCSEQGSTRNMVRRLVCCIVLHMTIWRQNASVVRLVSRAISSLAWSTQTHLSWRMSTSFFVRMVFHCVPKGEAVRNLASCRVVVATECACMCVRVCVSKLLLLEVDPTQIIWKHRINNCTFRAKSLSWLSWFWRKIWAK